MKWSINTPLWRNRTSLTPPIGCSRSRHPGSSRTRPAHAWHDCLRLSWTPRPRCSPPRPMPQPRWSLSCFRKSSASSSWPKAEPKPHITWHNWSKRGLLRQEPWQVATPPSKPQWHPLSCSRSLTRSSWTRPRSRTSWPRWRLPSCPRSLRSSLLSSYPPTDGPFLRRTDFLDGRIFAQITSKIALNGFLTDCQKKVLNGLLWALFWKFVGKFWQFFEIFGHFISSLANRFFLCGRLTLIS